MGFISQFTKVKHLSALSCQTVQKGSLENKDIYKFVVKNVIDNYFPFIEPASSLLADTSAAYLEGTPISCQVLKNFLKAASDTFILNPEANAVVNNFILIEYKTLCSYLGEDL